MSLCGLGSAYIAINLSLITLFGLILLLSRWNMSSRQILKLGYAGTAAIASFVLFQPLFPHHTFFEPPIKVWAARAPALVTLGDATERAKAVIALPSYVGAPEWLSALQSENLLLLAFGVVLLGFFCMVGREIFRFRRLRARAFTIRKYRCVRILACDFAGGPFSIWVPRGAYVVVPTSLVGSAQNLRLAILHELQHHRQRDTRWIYVMRALQFLCFANPFAHLWVKRLGELQELACDEALVGRKNVSVQDYARCLIRVAETALFSEERYACSTGLIFRGKDNPLRRRISAMMKENSSKEWVGKWKLSCASVLALLALGCVAWGSQGLIGDRQITMAQARQMAQEAENDGFPIVVNDLVLQQLNRYVGTPEGRDFIRASLGRMKTYQPMIESKIHEYGVPPELMAIPIVESGYQNLGPQKGDISRSAGLWQFLQPTAWLYTLNVWPPVDERMDPAKETDAAMRLLLGDKIRFGSWDLAILAYNSGEKIVSKGILKTGSHDPWALIRRGYEGDHAYLAKVMAAMLIMKDPRVLE